jgi:hypothetical protein
MTSSTLRGISLRALLAWCVLSVTGYFLLSPIIGAILPMLEITIDVAQRDYLPHLSVV